MCSGRWGLGVRRMMVGCRYRRALLAPSRRRHEAPSRPPHFFIFFPSLTPRSPVAFVRGLPAATSGNAPCLWLAVSSLLIAAPVPTRVPASPSRCPLALCRDQRPTIVPTGPYKNVFDIAYFKRAPGAAPLGGDAAAAPAAARAASPFLSAVRFHSWLVGCFFFFSASAGLCGGRLVCAPRGGGLIVIGRVPCGLRH